jgi:hypothetical protein
MKKISIIILMIAALTLMFFFGCKERGEEEAPKETAEKAEEKDAGPSATAGNILVEELSNPDEALIVLMQNVDRDLWGNYLDDSVAYASDQAEVLAFSVGAKSTNALLAVFLDEYETAEKLAGAIQEAAAKLNVQSAEIEALAKELGEDFKETDEEVREGRAKQRLNLLRQTVVNALQDIGNEGVALMIEFGAWAESMRQVSGIVSEDYSPEAAQALIRGQEATYFMKRFATLSLKDEKEEYRQIMDALSELQNYTKPTSQRSVSRENVGNIFEVTTAIVESFK